MNAVVVVDAVPRMFENCVDKYSSIEYVNYKGEPTGNLDVYADWHPDHQTIPPNVYVTATTPGFSLGLHIPPKDARIFAKALIAGAELEEATQAALDAQAQALAQSPVEA